MGGLSHLFYFNNGVMARKIFTQKSHDDDLEAPRNSLELQVETSQSYCDISGLSSCYGLEEEWYERNCYPLEASMKKLINDELSKRSNTKQNAPSLVAKLMGVDSLPLDFKSVVWPNHKKDDYHETKLSEKERNRRGCSVGHYSAESNSSRQMGTKLEKPKRREHPQEEELQKFKKEFEAWQAARFKECSRIVDTSDNEKLGLFQNPRGSELKNGKKREESDSIYYHRRNSELLVPEKMEKIYTRSRSFGRDFDQKISRIEYDQKLDSAPTRIVVLKPGPHRVYAYEDSLTTSSGTLDDRGGIEDFLEEVKERLRCELQGRALKRSSTVRGSGIETPFSEKPSYNNNNNTMQVVHISRDTGKNLPRSESTRSYRSEIQLDAEDMPDFVSKDTRRLLAERLKNVLKRETHPALDTEKRQKQTGEILEYDQEDIRTRSFRRSNDYEDGEDERVGKRDLSPRNLIRSLSAPVSGTSFGKLLLEDRHVLTGAQIRRKHEAIEHISVDPIRRKDRFNFRKRVSSFRSTLRGRLFGKKIQSMIESNSLEHDYIKDLVIGPRSINFYERNENSTEVPPSPASVCSSTPEEFWRNSDYLSPISTPDVTIADENGMPQVFRDISSNLNELRRQINELESNLQEDTPIEQEAKDLDTIDLENPAKAYVLDLLVASGLYDGSFDKSLDRWDPFAKPISKSVFEETEQNHRKMAEENENEIKNTGTDHKILFDLLNEALAAVLGPPVTKSSLRRKVVGSYALAPSRGRKLLESTWKMMCERLYPQTERSYYSLDGIIGWDLGNTPWTGLMDEEISVLGREVECLILGDLVDEVVKDLELVK